LSQWSAVIARSREPADRNDDGPARNVCAAGAFGVRAMHVSAGSTGGHESSMTIAKAHALSVGRGRRKVEEGKCPRRLRYAGRCCSEKGT